MAGFKALTEACKNFEEELQLVATELFSAKISETFEDGVAKKLRDLSLFTSKLRLLRTKTLALTQQAPDHDCEVNTILSEYEDTVVQRLVEQQVVKSATEAQAVKALIMAKDSSLDAEMLERKQKILAALSEYRAQESTLQQFEMVLQDKEAKLLEVRQTWDKELTAVNEMHREGETGFDENDHYYKKLVSMVDKLELMRWVWGRLAMPRSSHYDWARDPQRRLHTLKLNRQAHTVDMFLQDT